MLAAGSADFCVAEIAGCEDASAAGTLHHATEASTIAAMNLLFIPSLLQLGRTCDHKSVTGVTSRSEHAC